MTDDQLDRRDMSLLAKLTLPEESAPPWSLALALLTVGVMLLGLTLIGPSLVMTGKSRPVVFATELMSSWAIGMAVAIMFVLFSRRSSQESWQALRLIKGELPLSWTVFIGIAVALAVDLAVSLASGKFEPVPQVWGFVPHGAEGVLLAGLLLIVLQPLSETLVFQGVLLPRLRWNFGHWRGLIGTSALYTLLYHLVFIEAYAFYNPLWHGIVFPMSIGVLFSLLKVYTQSTVAVCLGRMGAGLVFLLTALAIYGSYPISA